MKSISFESLKNKIKQHFIAHYLAIKNPGEFVLYRMSQMLGKQEVKGGLSVYNLKDEQRHINSVIDNWDIRDISTLLDCAKKVGVNLPSWLYGRYCAELTDSGWFLFAR